MNISSKYTPMVFVLFYCLLGLFISLFVGILGYFLKSQPILKNMEATFFLALVAILLGILFCEIRNVIKNRTLGAILFGLISPIIFILSLQMYSYFLNGVIPTIPFNFYIVVTAIMAVITSLLYIGVTAK